ncbi:type II toxin-antitoxin system HicA family toxin [Candidatus Sumerlaeota bacterium]|nr:type II toxin-antitoxin system HicA family toxin [Candidatus Sumerlaeota bacterium]MBI3735764.1 type II toxin-antitoxin system HicA family toxin [Candidatus Sumerlaeota bacterium]
MSRLPTVRPAELVAALRRAGFEPRRQTGSHLILKHVNGRRAVVPMHTRDLKRTTMASILKDAGLTDDQFQDLL